MHTYIEHTVMRDILIFLFLPVFLSPGPDIDHTRSGNGAAGGGGPSTNYVSASTKYQTAGMTQLATRQVVDTDQLSGDFITRTHDYVIMSLLFIIIPLQQSALLLRPSFPSRTPYVCISIFIMAIHIPCHAAGTFRFVFVI